MPKVGSATVHEYEARSICIELDSSRPLQRVIDRVSLKSPSPVPYAPKPTQYGRYKMCEKFWTEPSRVLVPQDTAKTGTLWLLLNVRTILTQPGIRAKKVFT